MTRSVLTLVIANVAVFLLTQTQPALVRTFWYVPAQVLERPWTLITYMFLHGGWSHLLFNMLGLYFFGSHLEVYLGQKRFLILYFVSGLSAALLSSVFSPLTPIIGASGGVYGVFIAFATFWPRQEIYIWGIFPIQARWMVVGMTALTLFGGFGGASDGIAHFAHLGGFLGGYLYVRWLRGQVTRAATPKATAVKVTSSDLERWSRIDSSKLHEVNREELDRIRKKLADTSAELTERERDFLERFSRD